MFGLLYAMAPPTAADSTAGGPNPIMMLVPWIGFFVLIYFFFLRPQQKTQNERKNLLEKLAEGDRVVTVGGIYATVVKVNKDDDTVQLKIAENTQVKASRQSVDRLQK